MPEWYQFTLADSAKGGATHRGRPKSAQARARMSAAHIGHSPSAETRAKIGAAGKGRIKSPETRAKLSAAKRGIPRTAEEKAKISATLMGHATSAEHRARISAAGKGRRHSAETRAKISASHRRRTTTPEEIERRLAGVARWRESVGNGRWRSRLELRAAALLPAFTPQFRIERHAFDYASPDRGLLIEVNGCYYHVHSSVDKACRYGKLDDRAGAVAKDARVRAIAERAGAKLIVLWECQEAQWPQQLAVQGV